MIGASASSEEDRSRAARRRTARLAAVARLRRALPALAMVLLVVCTAQIIWRGISNRTPADAPDSDLTMTSPRFSGQARDGRTYLITGAGGRRDETGAARIAITAPIITLRDAAGVTTVMSAKSGLYDQSAETLLLTNEVRVDNGAGARFTASQATVNTRTGVVSGQQGLQADSAVGSVTSESATATDDGDRIIFKGGVRGRLNPKN